MAQCWHEHVPSDFEVEMARCRSKARSAGANDAPRTTHAVVLGIVLALSSVVPLIQGRSLAPLESVGALEPSVTATAAALHVEWPTVRAPLTPPSANPTAGRRPQITSSAAAEAAPKRVAVQVKKA